MVFPQWQQAPASPQLQPGRVDVWRIDLAAFLADEANAPAPTDSPVPRHAADAQRDAGHRAMHHILSRYLGNASGELLVAIHPGGKPYLSRPRLPLEFNLSHSTDIALFAIAADCAVGIDVETHREIDDPLRLARRVMSAEETTQIAALPAPQRLALFLDLWTRMEARQKALGHGIFAQPVEPDLVSGFGFRPGERFYASLAVAPKSSHVDLRFFDFGRL